MEIIFATNNRHKLAEARAILGEDFKLITPKDLNLFDDIPESADTLEGNALIKAQYLWERFHLTCFADDTGLEVDALNGAPGVYSARYAGEEQNSKNNIQKLLKELEGIKQRRARFRTVAVLIIDGTAYYFQGILNGEIAETPSGNGGFGYDPVFIPDGYTKTLAELSTQEKNLISHRGFAMRELSRFLNNK
ncbi:MAG: non-canonical purine NTP diphosphatase [Bacteroidales bacterium]